MEPNTKGKLVKVPWYPNDTMHYNQMRVEGEESDGVYQPLYHRDYYRPTGYYDPIRGTFNTCKPFTTFAKDTGTDISYVYTLIENIGGEECALHLLAWLRAKMIAPTVKTQVIPIIISRTQGTGKSSFADSICTGLFGKDNVIVSDQYDSTAKFNSDSYGKLIISMEEKYDNDKRNPIDAIKSRATARQIRVENKGKDPYYVEAHSEFIMTTNKDVPVKVEDMEQRRFLVMDANENFTRKTSALAEEVFTKLYGINDLKETVGIPFTDNLQAIEQLKFDLATREDIRNKKLNIMPKTAGLRRLHDMPRTTEAVDIESILRSIVPFIRASLLEGKLVTQIEVDDQVISIANYIQIPTAINYMPAINNMPAMVILCRPVVFYDTSSGRVFPHATTERVLYDCARWLRQDFGLDILPNMFPLPGGFKGMQNKYAYAPVARIVLATDNVPKTVNLKLNIPTVEETVTRVGVRLRVNGKWQPDVNGEFETVNEMKPGTTTLADKNNNVQYMDTFLFESDDTDAATFSIEEAKCAAWQHGDKSKPLDALRLFYNRLEVQRSEARRLFRQGTAARIVYSGGKSIHIIVRVADSPQTLEEYKWLHAQLAITLSDKLNFDPTTSDPARLTRAPITHKRTFTHCGAEVEGTQHPVDVNWNNVYNYEWRSLYMQWQNRPPAQYELKRKLMPTNQEYKDAMVALLNGTYWTDSTWNGNRQRTFFSAYRLCRYVGYTHDDLWTDAGILDGLNNYYRPNEIQYWRNREHCDLIKEIDKDEDSRDEEV
jgi:hypothetical protein